MNQNEEAMAAEIEYVHEQRFSEWWADDPYEF